MSSFLGTMREYPLLSLDRFDGKNLTSTAYFLSHNHSDHTVGLDARNFAYRLSSNSHIKLYCSEKTKSLICFDGAYANIRKSIVALEINKPHEIAVYDPETTKVKEHVSCTPLPAGHCPGSVMFLIEGAAGRVLYTGDFRLQRQDLIAMEALHSGSSPKPIRSLYLDTTFCIPQALYIPTRENSTSAVIDIIAEWIKLGDQHCINIKHKANLGYENLFQCVAEHFNTKVHVSDGIFERYKFLGRMTDYTTTDPSSTQIHACHWKKPRHRNSYLPCGYYPSNRNNPQHVRTIFVSTMYFTLQVDTDTFAKRFHDKFYRACYSFHSSYVEVRDMVEYLKPTRAVPNVIPMNETMETIQRRLDRFVKTAKDIQPPTQSPLKYRPLGKLKVRRKHKRTPTLTTEDSLDFGEDSCSPKKKLQLTPSQLEPCTHSEVSLGDLKSQFPNLLGSNGNDSENDLSSSQKSAKVGDSMDKSTDEAVVEQYTPDLFSDSLEESDGSEKEGEVDVLESLSQEDRQALQSFEPVMPEIFGQSLGYISDGGDDEEPDEDNCDEKNSDADLNLITEQKSNGEDERASPTIAKTNLGTDNGDADVSSIKQVEVVANEQNTASSKIECASVMNNSGDKEISPSNDATDHAGDLDGDVINSCTDSDSTTKTNHQKRARNSDEGERSKDVIEEKHGDIYEDLLPRKRQKVNEIGKDGDNDLKEMGTCGSNQIVTIDDVDVEDNEDCRLELHSPSHANNQEVIIVDEDSHSGINGGNMAKNISDGSSSDCLDSDMDSDATFDWTANSKHFTNFSPPQHCKRKAVQKEMPTIDLTETDEEEEGDGNEGSTSRVAETVRCRDGCQGYKRGYSSDVICDSDECSGEDKCGEKSYIGQLKKGSLSDSNKSVHLPSIHSHRKNTNGLKIQHQKPDSQSSPRRIHEGLNYRSSANKRRVRRHKRIRSPKFQQCPTHENPSKSPLGLIEDSDLSSSDDYFNDGEYLQMRQRCVKRHNKVKRRSSGDVIVLSDDEEVNNCGQHLTSSPEKGK